MYLRHLAPLLTLPLLAACAPQLQGAITTGEVSRVAATDQVLEVTALLRLPQPSFAECQANLDTLGARLETLAPVTTEPRCVAEGLDTYAQLGTPLPIVSYGSAPGHRLAAIVALPTNSGATDLAFRLLRSYDDIFYTLADGISSRPRLEPTAITIALRNDGAAPLSLLAGGEVLVDGAVAPRDTVLPAGATVQLRLTAVAGALVESRVDYTFASFRSP